ncbi:hypothetical protein K505DRAFT_10143 [Melanomma pulvis-pyrius CBS 109.77]|uniref:Uncharacterized protein n=1 Tax=Melanomma pulvis-pyrius CBS 109.77 TaxID=1314802 RepID=A0A6A6XHG9_9PLEO|nr:hypothetical protein K505DRAFT_10143 [Melanomma pulvis-pyrius CBS 109.77]
MPWHIRLCRRRMYWLIRHDSRSSRPPHCRGQHTNFKLFFLIPSSIQLQLRYFCLNLLLLLGRIGGLLALALLRGRRGGMLCGSHGGRRGRGCAPACVHTTGRIRPGLSRSCVVLVGDSGHEEVVTTLSWSGRCRVTRSGQSLDCLPEHSSDYSYSFT